MNMPNDWTRHIAEHWAKAVTKHPHFVDLVTRQTEEQVWRRLSDCRAHVKEQEEKRTLAIKDLIECEFIEAMAEYMEGRLDRCIDEMYDTIAVLMRAVRLVERAAERRRKRDALLECL